MQLPGPDQISIISQLYICMYFKKEKKFFNNKISFTLKVTSMLKSKKSAINPAFVFCLNSKILKILPTKIE